MESTSGESWERAPTFGSSRVLARCRSEIRRSLAEAEPFLPLFMENYKEQPLPEGYDWFERWRAAIPHLRRAIVGFIVLAHRAPNRQLGDDDGDCENRFGILDDVLCTGIILTRMQGETEFHGENLERQATVRGVYVNLRDLADFFT